MNPLSSYHRTRLLLATAAAICFCVFWWAGELLRIPPAKGHDASLMLMPSLIVPLGIVIVAMAISVAAGTAVAGKIRFNAGLLTATLGLAALSIRGGSSRYTLFWGLAATNSPESIFQRFMSEMVVLGLLVGAMWWVLRGLYLAGRLRDREEDAPEMADAAHLLPELGLQLVVTAAGIMLLAQSEDKQQVLAAVFLGSFGGAAAVHSTFQTGPRGWYWLPPLLVGLIGYGIGYFDPPQGVMTADMRGPFAGLVRPLPLDYASAGPAGAILGHWMSRKWQKEREAMNRQEAEG